MRRIKQRREKIEKSKKFNGLLSTIPWLIFIAILVLLISLYVSTSNLNRFVFVTKPENLYSNSTAIVLVDPSQNLITKFAVDDESRVSVSRGYGTYLLKNVWQFSTNEKKEGMLVAETVTKNFLIPVSKYHSDSATNLSFWQRTYLKMHDLRIVNPEIREIEISKTGKQASNVLIYFNNNYLSESVKEFEIIEMTHGTKSSNFVSEIVESVGLKVTNYKRESSSDFDCEIATSSQISKEIDLLVSSLGCDLVIDEKNIDKITIKYGEKFSSRF